MDYFKNPLERNLEGESNPARITPWSPSTHETRRKQEAAYGLRNYKDLGQFNRFKRVWYNSTLERIRLLPSEFNGLRYDDTDDLATGLWFLFYVYIVEDFRLDYIDISLTFSSHKKSTLEISVIVDSMKEPSILVGLRDIFLHLISDVNNENGWLSVGNFSTSKEFKEQMVDDRKAQGVKSILLRLEDTLTLDLYMRLEDDLIGVRSAESASKPGLTRTSRKFPPGWNNPIEHYFLKWSFEDKVERMSSIIIGSFQ